MPNTTVNAQITDAVTETNVKILADAPGMAMANLYQATGQGIGQRRAQRYGGAAERQHHPPGNHDPRGRAALCSRHGVNGDGRANNLEFW